MSFGIASWMTGEAPEEFVARADAALYRAKSTGRNRVEAASDVRV
jgi:PleD family two-component response regulator